MTIDIQAPEIRLEETPREIIADYCVSESGELPINGGWGYQSVSLLDECDE
jgi:hypothetical protein